MIYFTGEFLQTVQQEITPILLKFFQTMKERIFLNPFYEIGIIVVSNSEKKFIRKLQTNIIQVD